MGNYCEHMDTCSYCSDLASGPSSAIHTSPQINELAAALAKAQGEMGGAVKDSANPFFKSSYADLASVRDACIPALTKHGLCVIQAPSARGKEVSVETLLAHSSGQWTRSTITASGKDDSPQAVGSCITYLRRYALQSIAGVAPEDDDGEAAQGRDKPQASTRQTKNGNGPEKPAAPPPAPPGGPLNNEQRAQLLDLAKSAGMKNADLLALCGTVLKRPVHSSQEIGADEFKAVLGAVEDKAMASKEEDVEAIFGPGARG